VQQLLLHKTAMSLSMMFDLITQDLPAKLIYRWVLF